MKISFGMPNPIAAYGTRPKHYGVKKFIPVYARVEVGMEKNIWTGQWTQTVWPRYERLSCNFFIIQPTRWRAMWRISQVKRIKAGQLKLF